MQQKLIMSVSTLQEEISQDMLRNEINVGMEMDSSIITSGTFPNNIRDILCFFRNILCLIDDGQRFKCKIFPTTRQPVG